VTYNWREDANCLGINTDLWFPEGDGQVSAKGLREVCGRCSVIDQCLDWAVRHEAHGYWAGTHPTERAQMRRARGIFLEAPEARVYGHAR